MRWILMMVLLGVTLAAFADGLAYGKAFRMLTETDQSAVIALQPGTATVDMYIGITGIPKGETITYILPFWYAPDGFRMQEMDSATFQERYARPAHDRVVNNNALTLSPRDLLAHPLIEAGMTIGTAFIGPANLFLLPLLAPAREKGRTQAGAADVTPYHTATTPNARAELYRINTGDLQALLTQAGLPPAYLAPLRKYRTPHFAVMRLTGTGGPTTLGRTLARGIHYHFRHRLPADGRGYRYVYPLGTGAAWAKPIELTEVYVTCPDAWQLDTQAPTEGLATFYHNPIRWARDLRQNTPVDPQTLAYLLEEQASIKYLMRYPGTYHITPPPLKALLPATAHLLEDAIIHPTAWHALYFHSNPSRDITVNLTPRPQAWRLPLARALASRWVAYPLCILALLLAWAVAGRLLLLPVLRRIQTPVTLWPQVALMAGHALLLMGGISTILIGGVMLAATLPVFELAYFELASMDLAHYNSTFWSLFTVLGLGVVSIAAAVVLRRRQPRAIAAVSLWTWLTALGIYGAVVLLLHLLNTWALRTLTG